MRERRMEGEKDEGRVWRKREEGERERGMEGKRDEDREVWRERRIKGKRDD